MSSPRSLIQHFQALDAFLTEHRALWQPRPFVEGKMAWETEYPQLAVWLRQRSLTEAEAAHNDPGALAAPEPFRQIATRAIALSQLPPLQQHTTATPDPRLMAGIPGRKASQIQAFAAHLQFHEKPRHWLDWCAGKGHLGRYLANGSTTLTSLEWDQALVEEAKRLSLRLDLEVQHHCQDVMAADCPRHLQPEQTAVALHACGDLHVRLIQLGIEHQCRQLAIAPCCYNRIHGDSYQPLSSAAQSSRLQLSRDDLGLPLSETVTAGARERRQRDQSMAWRLGFDLLQRKLRENDSYLPTPSLPSAWLKKSFEQYCRDLATLKGIPEPQSEPWPELEQRGWQRLAEVRNLELLRGLFRRPLELWLLLDRTLLLAENGYRVQLGTFCSSTLTPRNLLLLAEFENPPSTLPATHFTLQ